MVLLSAAPAAVVEIPNFVSGENPRLAGPAWIRRNAGRPMNPPPPLVDLKCRNCGAALAATDISPQLGAARCGHCRSLFALPAAAPAAIPRPQAPLPPALSVRTEADTLVITRRWRSAAAWFLLFFAVFWNGFMVVWHGISLASGAWFMSAFGLIHTAVGLFLIYYVAALFVNSTVIRASRGGLSVKTGPLPWKGDCTLDASSATQFFCTEKIHRGKNGSSTSYTVEVVLPGNQRRSLATGLPDPDQAIFIEQQLERHLGITDVPVAGEHGR
jgi:hypothetical protein